MVDKEEYLENPELARAGAAVKGLSHEQPQPNLVARTLARISAQYRPVKKAFWMLRPITHPLARIAAAAAIILTLTPMTDLNMADPLGSRIERGIIGAQTAENVEHFLDKLLVRYTSGWNYTECNPDLFMGAQRTQPRQVRRTPVVRPSGV